jgi:hypothetical protein
MRRHIVLYGSFLRRGKGPGGKGPGTLLVRLISPDDRTALGRAALVYDALCAQLKSETPPPARRARPKKGVSS